jgi:uncharacterized protein HemX
MDISFRGSNAGVTAESIGAPPPVCAPKSTPVIDSFGSWQCESTGGGTSSGSSLLLLAALAGAGYWWFTKHKQKHQEATV